MTDQLSTGPLRVGFVGSGFIANFHMKAMLGVRDVRIAAVQSRSAERREAFAEKVNALDLGPRRAFASLKEMALSGEVDAIWILCKS